MKRINHIRPQSVSESDGSEVVVERLHVLPEKIIKPFMPGADPNYSDWKTDIFALGSTFYYRLTFFR